MITRQSPGLPLPATRLVKPGGICFAGTVLKSKASSVAAADPTAASHNPTIRLNMPSSLTKRTSSDKEMPPDGNNPSDQEWGAECFASPGQMWASVGKFSRSNFRGTGATAGHVN